MRPGQQNRRGRGRNGRKGQSPMSRNYESNGPDVKIRGTASHIAEKYMALARDATSSGDQVMAENYLQHAEHYNRIIMAAQAQFQEQMGQRMRGPEGELQGGEGGQSDGGYDADDEGYDEQPFAPDHMRHGEFRGADMPRGFEPQPAMPRQQSGEGRSEGRSHEGRQGGDGRQGGHGEGRGQQGEFRGRRNRHRHDNSRYRQNQGAGMSANPADIAAMAAANGSGMAEGDRRRSAPPEQPSGPEPAADE
ncbi:MAG: DUF4167 domain-containing protein [Hyphomicrobiaceae bacterium]